MLGREKDLYNYNEEISIDKLIEIINSKKNIDNSNIEKIFFKYKGEISFEKFKLLIEKYNIEKHSKISYELIKLIPKTAKNIRNILEYFNISKDEEIDFLRTILFECESIGGKIFNEILERTMSNDSNIYTEMENIVDEFIQKNIDYIDININKGAIDGLDDLYFGKKPENLLLYIRYGHRNDNPEIAEILAIFLYKMIEKKKFRYFNKLKIVTRFSDRFYPRFLIESLGIDEDIYFLQGQDFEKILLENTTIFTSHSSTPKSDIYGIDCEKPKLPYIVSGGMYKESLSYKVDIELEKSKANKSVNIKLLEAKYILNEYLEKLFEIEDFFSEILKKKLIIKSIIEKYK